MLQAVYQLLDDELHQILQLRADRKPDLGLLGVHRTAFRVLQQIQMQRGLKREVQHLELRFPLKINQI